ncbi:MAG: porin family protein [Bradyrhizobium sp.]|uniref:outer membrane protein n=1 Tax=Bradyrhizobium sp. TaxID=376 RepID=UPI00120587C2|nr:outer membrane beta-barrel protein [Bradyrhizobium sp.]THD63213.1 MAG: porin family protein [Bradyrhizobium sp.]
MRRSLVLTAVCAIAGSIQVAAAADMPTKAPVYAPVLYSWTGFYVGGQAGGGWFTNHVTNGLNPTDGTVNFPPGFVHNAVHGSGWLGGGYAGYNYQVNQLVVGIDGDYSWAHLTGSTSDIGPTGFTDISHETVKWIATVTGRLGYAANNWMFFGKAGWAWAGFNGVSSTFNLAGANTNNDTNAQTRDGWTVGTGVEWGFAEHWSAKLEYDYVKFMTANYVNTAVSVSGAVTFPGRSATSNLSIVELGVAYRF